MHQQVNNNRYAVCSAVQGRKASTSFSCPFFDVLINYAAPPSLRPLQSTRDAYQRL